MGSPGPSRLHLPSDMSSSSDSYHRPFDVSLNRLDDSRFYGHTRATSDSSTDSTCFSRSPDDRYSYNDHTTTHRNSYSPDTDYRESRRPYSYSAPSDSATLREENIILHTENNILKSTNASIMAMLSQATLAPAPAHNQMSSMHPAATPLNEKNYPRVKFWQRSKWEKLIERNHGVSNGGNQSRNSLTFIEDSDGQSPSDAKIRQIRKWSYKFFYSLQSRGLAPPVWGQVSLEARRDFRSAVEKEFTDLCFCDGHWKVDQVGTIVYSSWNASHGTGKIKEEMVSGDEEDEDDEIIEISKSRKRSRIVSTTGAPPAKRSKAEEAKADHQDGEKRKKKNKKTKNPLHGLTPPVSATFLAPPPPAPIHEPAPAHDPPAPTPTPKLAAPDPEPAPAPAPAPNREPTPTPVHEPTPTPVHEPAPAPPAHEPVTTHTLDSARTTVPLPHLAIAGHTAAPAAPNFEHPPAQRSPLLPLPNPSSNVRTPIVPHHPAPNSLAQSGKTSHNPKNTVAPTKKKKWNPLSTSTTARALCAVSYRQQNGDKVDANDFRIYWDSMSTTDKALWTAREANAKLAALNAATGDSGQS
ncbi:hypothetical protein B0H17DRAFT_1211557 [Mycena rosella]|uniref:Uncharacterized protein n=1 Tax=Mycena rosella TaxID=1033263 RepID=A0AAD7CUF9_MYCRO|nr:hypothetical protein B0H17DRAFT_1211557 [Mycena rosella]